jgi:hypothetical protein
MKDFGLLKTLDPGRLQAAETFHPDEGTETDIDSPMEAQGK